MKKKLSLDAEALAVESFATGTQTGRGEGTVHANADDCTWFVSCPCPTHRYQCADSPETSYSCNYTHDHRCTT
ncbi:MAG TPA: hypothetical protein VFX98_18920 [Longimicrobiaceae bacterium]|nr:hypothetical protein [Longimicrobiaceae bacterium]